MIVENDILIVESNIADLKLLSEVLQKEGYKVRPAEKAQMVIDLALAKPPGLILLDVRMPVMDGFEVCRRIKQEKSTHNIPIIFITTQQDREARGKGYEAGGVDFITKPFHAPEVLVTTQLEVTAEEESAQRLALSPLQ